MFYYIFMKKCTDSVFAEIIDMSGLNIDFLSVLSNISKSTLYKINRGLLPTDTKKGLAIADFLKVDVAYLQNNQNGSICFLEATNEGFICKKIIKSNLKEYLKNHSIFTLLDFRDITRFSVGGVELNKFYNEINLYFFNAFIFNIFILQYKFHMGFDDPLFMRKIKNDINFLTSLEDFFTLEEASKHSRMYSIWEGLRHKKIYENKEFPFETISIDLCKDNEIIPYKDILNYVTNVPKGLTREIMDEAVSKEFK